MGLFSSNNPKEKQHSGILGAFSVDVIKWEPETNAEASIIAHKFEYEDFPNGSYLIVGPSQTAIFTNNMASGSAQGGSASGQAQMTAFVGPCKIKLETGDSRFAPFRNIGHALTGGESEFHSTVYFINTTYLNDLTWGTVNPVLVEDPEEKVNVHVRAQGMFGVHIEQEDPTQAEVQARKFLQKVVGTRADFTKDELIKYMRAKIQEYVPNLLANTIIRQNVGILKISAYLSDFSDNIRTALRDHFDGFGITLDNFSFHNINVPDEDLRIINDAKKAKVETRLKAEAEAERIRLEAEARAAGRAMEGYTYQDEQTFKVLSEAAKNEGNSGSMMNAGMGIGMGFGMGNMMGNAMNNIAQNAMVDMTPAPAPQPQGTACPKCGVPTASGAKFCHQCGHSLKPVCPGCGKDLQPGSKFCPECGAKL